jgi:phospholipase/carboxylesterase
MKEHSRMDQDEFISRLTQVLQTLESSFRIDPLMLRQVRENLLRHAEVLSAARNSFSMMDREDPYLKASELVLAAINLFGSGDDLNQAFMNVLRSYRKFARVQELLFPLREESPQIDRFFREEAVPERAAADKGSQHPTGILHVHVGMEDDPYARGGYSLYVPETYRESRAWPLIVALHGGYSHGRDFLWTWLREARSRGYFLFSPTSAGRTWSIGAIESDAQPLLKKLDLIQSEYRIDPSRILLTGMSDGATFALGMGLGESMPYSAIAPVSGVLPPVDLSHARGRRIYWVHGEQDWMFPVGRAVHACRRLKEAGIDVALKVVHDLSHAYPREQNSGILRWFDPDPA